MHMITNKMMLNFNMLTFGVKDWIICQIDSILLSRLIATPEFATPKLLSCCFILRICVHQFPRVTYSASAVEKATVLCFLEY